MNTLINFKSFNPSYTSSLVFAIFEGLRPGESFQIISEENLENIKTHFLETNIDNFRWDSTKLSNNTWEIRILKEEERSHHKSGCCGICGNAG